MQSLDLAQQIDEALTRFAPLAMRGRVQRAVGMLIEAVGVQPQIGELCHLQTPGAGEPMLAEVVGISQGGAVLTPLGRTQGLSASTEVIPTGHGLSVGIGDALLGRVLNALGEPIDDLGAMYTYKRLPIQREPLAPLARRLIDRSFVTGIRTVDGLITMGEGQRIGIFAQPGVGKSTLLGMLARATTPDVIVVALIGERGREVQEFIEHSLGSEGLAKSVLVVSTSDRPPMERIKSAYVATTIAEYFRDQGKSVLLLVDSLTRFARAQREIGLASGEPPTRRSYPPSIFSMLPQLLERAGLARDGSITACYTVLTEGDEENDPIAEEVRSILDGHIVLSRPIAAAQRYPAIDVLASLSRVMPQVASEKHRAAAARLRGLIAKYQEIELLLQIGEYKPGADALADQAVKAMPAIHAFLNQRTHESIGLDETLKAMTQCGK